MRQDQYEKLQAIEERLMDVYLTEADPNNWPAAEPGKECSGDRYRMKRAATETAHLLSRTIGLIGGAQQIGSTTPAAEQPVDGEAEAASHLEREVQAAERESVKRRDRIERETSRIIKAAKDRKGV